MRRRCWGGDVGEGEGCGRVFVCFSVFHLRGIGVVSLGYTRWDSVTLTSAVQIITSS